MAKKVTHNWKPPSWLNEPVASTAWFHDEEVEIYEGTTEVKNIQLWRDNFRTILDLDQLQEEKNKPLAEITDDEIIEYIFHQGLHKIPDLAKSIKMDSIRVPLILSYDKVLLDGNRRFLACKYLIKKEKRPSPKFTIVPARGVDPKISDDTKLKIIAEMNFLDPHREEWPRNVRAEFAIAEFKSACTKLGDESQAYDYINRHLDVPPSELKRWQAVVDIIGEYIRYVEEKEGRKARQEAQRFGRAKFHFFEEFYNKAIGCRNRIQDTSLLSEAKELLFRYLREEQIVSTTAVREFTSIVRYMPARIFLKKPKGNFQTAKTLYDEYAGSRRASQKIARFSEWLATLSKSEINSVSGDLKNHLLQVVKKFARQ